MKRAFIIFFTLLSTCAMFLVVGSKVEAQMGWSTGGQEQMLLQNSSALVFVENIILPKTNYSAGETIAGKLTLSNQRDLSASNVYYRIVLLNGYNLGSDEIKYDYSEMQGPIFLSGKEKKVVSFKYIIPKSISGNNLVLHAVAMLKNGSPMGYNDTYINVANGIGMVTVSGAKMTVGTKTFSLQEGPTIYSDSEQMAVLDITLKNNTNDKISLTPLINIHKRPDPSNIISSFKSDTIFVWPESETRIYLNLPTFEYSPQVYVGDLLFLDENNILRAPKLEFRYVIGGDIVTINSVTSNKTKIKQGETFSITVNYSGTPKDILTSKVSGGGLADFNLRVFNQDNKLVAEYADKTDFNKGDAKYISVEALKNASALRAEVTISNNDKILAFEKYFFSPNYNANNYFLIIIILCISILVASLTFISKKKLFFSIFILFIFSFGFLSADKATASVSITSVSNDQQTLTCATTACFSVSIYKGYDPSSGGFDPADYYATVTAEGNTVTSSWATDSNPNQTANICFSVPYTFPTGTSRDIFYSVVSSSTGTVYTNTLNYYISCPSTAGACGSATTPPTTYLYTGLDTTISTNLCSKGISPTSKVLSASQGSTVSWTCDGIQGGSPANCLATRASNGTCGSAAKEYAPNDSFPNGNYCTYGTALPATPANPAQGSSSTWICKGLSGGADSPVCVATRRVLINGVCGSSATNYQYTGSDTTISTSLCSSGTPSISSQILLSAPGSTVSWTCAGDGGSSPYCTATRVLNATCGPAATLYSPTATFPSGSYCSLGTASPTTPSSPAQGSSSTWTCVGSGVGHTDATCTATRRAPINGACGTITTPPAVYPYTGWLPNLYPCDYYCRAYNYGMEFPGNPCAAGTPPSSITLPVAQGSTVSWTCAGIDGGTSATCTATRATNGACGTANKTYSVGSTSFGTDTTCTTGTANPINPIFPTTSNPTTTWVCNGINGGTPANCTASLAINGTCGTANKIYPAGSTSFGTDTACTSGTANPINPIFPTTSNSTTSWVCNGINGGTPSSNCIAKLIVNAVCGSSATNYTYTGSDTTISTNLCSAGTRPASNPVLLAIGASTVSWDCTGIEGGGSVSCLAVRNLSAACGPTAKEYSPTETWPAGAFCTTGASSPLTPANPVAGSSVTWTCQGVGGGASVTCTATRRAVTTGVCGFATTPPSTYLYYGTNDGSIFYGGYDTLISYGLCSKGTPLPLSVTLPAAPGATVSWVCNGTDGGGPSPACFAKRIANGVCGSASRDYAQGETFPGTGSSYCYSAIAPLTTPPSLGAIGGSTTTWTCPGAYGGMPSNCVATRATNGVCGTANKLYPVGSTSYGTGTFCSSGSPSVYQDFPRSSYFPVDIPPYFMGPVGGGASWSCIGYHGGTNASCDMTLKINGICGTANKTFPAGTGDFGRDSLCATGNVVKDGAIISPGGFESFPFWPGLSSNGVGTWTCAGLNGGTSANCTAKLAINGGCGSAVSYASQNSDITQYAFTGSSTTISQNLCATGNKPATNPVLPAAMGSTVSWTCSGINGGGNSTCTALRATNGTCGTANTTFPAGTQPPDWAGFWYDVDQPWIQTACWTASNCTAVGAYAYTFCAKETLVRVAPGFPTPDNPTVTWICDGINGGTPTDCTAKLKVNGVCGSATTPPTTYGYWQQYAWGNINTDATNISGGELCSMGTPPESVIVPATPGSSVSWTCAGINGGTVSSTCTAKRVINGECALVKGSWANGTQAVFSDGFWNPDYNMILIEHKFGKTTPWYTGPYCAMGTKSGTPVNPAVGGSTTWSCVGSNGGVTQNCRAIRLATLCGPATNPSVIYPYTGSATQVYNVCVDWTGPEYIWLPAEPGSTVTTQCGSIAKENCKVSRQLNGTCGSAARSYSPTEAFPGGDYCQWGGTYTPTTPAAPTVVTPSTWTCNGAYGGTSTTCSATRRVPVNGACGTGTTPPTYYPYTGFGTQIGSNLYNSNAIYALYCSAGNRNPLWPFPGFLDLPAGAGRTVSWTCEGTDGGTTATCTAQRSIPVYGSCGPAAKEYSPTETWPAGAYCLAGLTSPASPGEPGNGTYDPLYCRGTSCGSKAGIVSGAGVIVATGEIIDTIMVDAFTGGGGSFIVNCPVGTKYRVCVENKNDGNGNYVLLGVGKLSSWACVGSGGGTTANCVASRRAPINGACGSSATNYPYTNSPTIISTNLCSAGTAPASQTLLAPQGSTVSWTCAGIDGGTPATCTATRATNGVCGSAKRTYGPTETFPDGSYCSAGASPLPAPTNPAIGASSTWTCSGLNGGTSSTCTATRVANSCGSATTPPTNYLFNNLPLTIFNNLCAAGTPPAIYPVLPAAPGSTVNWTCLGQTCTAIRSSNGLCNSATAKSYSPTETFPAGTYCLVGSPTPATPTNPAIGASSTWTCSGLNGGSASPTCTATRRTPINGSCGTANNKTYIAGSTSFGSDTKCLAGTVNPANPIFPTNLNPTTTWTCDGIEGGTTANCSARLIVNGVCGSATTPPAAYKYSGTTTTISSNLCLPGSPSAILPGTQYKYRVSAINDAGTSAPSNTASATSTP